MARVLDDGRARHVAPVPAVPRDGPDPMIAILAIACALAIIAIWLALTEWWS